jgi:hypothetical protein
VPTNDNPLPTTEELSALTCKLLKNKRSEDHIKRALEIWKAKHEVLSESASEENDSISFDDVADKKLLPSLRKNLKYVGTSKGVEMAFKKYIASLNNVFSQAFKTQRISDEQLKNKLATDVLETGKLPQHILEALQKYQIDMREIKVHPVCAVEIRDVLGGPGIDIGRRDFEL